jgi:3-hydroxyacyl-[acyl-carrier-protein] dehydratase
MPSVIDLIPHRPPFLFVDEIVAEGPDSLVARRTFRADEDFYRGHYPGQPITPGVLLCEAVFQTGALLLARKAAAGGAGTRKPGEVPLLGRVREVKFRNPVFPGETVEITAKIKETMGDFTVMSGSIKSGAKRVLSVEFVVGWQIPGGAA